MMMQSTAPREMRVLSDAEIAMVAGGPDPGVNEAGVDRLVNRDTMIYRSPDGIFVQTEVTMAGMSASAIAWDSDHNGHYDVIWFQASNGAWLCSTDGVGFNACSSPNPLMNSYIDENFPEPNEVPEG